MMLTRLQATKRMPFFTVHKIRLFQSTALKNCYIRAVMRYVGIADYYLARRLRLSLLLHCYSHHKERGYRKPAGQE